MQVKTTCITDGASFKNAQLHDLPQQVEDALAGIAKEEATRFNDFALKYIGTLEEEGQVSCCILLCCAGRHTERCLYACSVCQLDVLQGVFEAPLHHCRCDGKDITTM